MYSRDTGRGNSREGGGGGGDAPPRRTERTSRSELPTARSTPAGVPGAPEVEPVLDGERLTELERESAEPLRAPRPSSTCVGITEDTTPFTCTAPRRAAPAPARASLPRATRLTETLRVE